MRGTAIWWRQTIHEGAHSGCNQICISRKRFNIELVIQTYDIMPSKSYTQYHFPIIQMRTKASDNSTTKQNKNITRSDTQRTTLTELITLL